MSAIRHLRDQWRFTALLYTCGLALGAVTIASGWAVGFALRWLMPSLLVSAYILWQCWRHLPDNHRQSEQTLLLTLGLGTALTLLRGLLLAALAGFLLLPRPSAGLLAWLPAVIYFVAVVLDYVDGYAARVTDHSAVLGEKLDLELDALGILIAPMLAVLYGQLPVWYLLVSAARYGFTAGLWLLKRRGRPVYNLTDSVRRRALAGFQMGLNVAVLLPLLAPPIITIVATVFMTPLMIGFTRDWLVASGSIDVKSSRYLSVTNVSEQLFYGWLPALLRLALILLAFNAVTSGAFSRLALPPAILIVVVTAGLIALGLLGRLSAVILMSIVGLVMRNASLDSIHGALIAIAALIFVLGTGEFSIWQPEDAFLRFRAGSSASQ